MLTDISEDTIKFSNLEIVTCQGMRALVTVVLYHSYALQRQVIIVSA